MGTFIIDKRLEALGNSEFSFVYLLCVCEKVWYNGYGAGI